MQNRNHINLYFVKHNASGIIREVNFFVLKRNDGKFDLIGTIPNGKTDLRAIRITLSDPLMMTEEFEMNNILRQQLPNFGCSLVEKEEKDTIIKKFSEDG